MTSDYLDWTSRKLKRRYIKSQRKVWNLQGYRNDGINPFLMEKFYTWYSRRSAYKKELDRRGWDV